VERMLKYTTLENSEFPKSKLETDKDLKNWPERGELEFKNVKFKYREDLDLTLKNISFKIQPGEKIGVCGRTGAGKSSTIQAIFRMVDIFKPEDE